MTNGSYGSRSHGWNRSDMDDTVRNGRFFDTSNRRDDGYGFYSSSGLDMCHSRHYCHPYRRSDREYFLDEFKKCKLTTFDGELKKLEETKTWLLGMKNCFELHEYMENMKVGIVIFNLKGKLVHLVGRCEVC